MAAFAMLRYKSDVVFIMSSLLLRAMGDGSDGRLMILGHDLGYLFEYDRKRVGDRLAPNLLLSITSRNTDPLLCVLSKTFSDANPSGPFLTSFPL